MSGEFDVGRYLTQRHLTGLGVGELEPGPALTAAERSARIRRGREKHGMDVPSTAGGREATLAAARARVGRRVERADRGPSLNGPIRRSLVDSSDARVCAGSGCKAININSEGPADEFCHNCR